MKQKLHMQKRIAVLISMAMIAFISAMPMTTFAEDSAASTVVEYPVSGGNIYFDTATGTVTKCDEEVTSAIIPEKIEGIQVVAVAENAFSYHCVRAVTLPKSLVDIGRGAFAYCRELKSINLPRGTKYIGERAFFSCESLKNIVIPEGVISIGSEAFNACVSLEAINIPSTVTRIEGNPFTNSYSIRKIEVAKTNKNFSAKDGILFDKNKTKIICYPVGKTNSGYTIPQTVTTIGEHAFFGSTYPNINCNLKSIKIPQSVKVIEDYAFAQCKGFESIEFPNSVNDMGENVLWECSNLLKVKLPSSIDTIPEGLFSSCKSLKSVTIPKGVRMIGFGAFSHCYKLEEVTLPDSINEIGQASFYYCNSLKSIAIPEGVTSIKDYTFSYCNSLSKILLPRSLQSIGEYAFRATALTRIIIPESVTKIHKDAFYEDGKVILCGKKGVYAETYANDNGIAFQEFIPKSIKKCTIQLESKNLVYDGKEKTVSVVVRDGDSLLEENLDYSVTYRDHINAGTGKVIVKGKGWYNDVIEKDILIKKGVGRISARSYTKAYGSSPFNLKASVNSDSKLGYKSSNKEVVTVDSAGKVTIKGIGIANITIIASATSNCNAATKNVTITVNPKKVAGLKVKNAKNQMIVSWEKDTKATGYQITYAQDSKFKNSKKDVTISQNNTVKKTIKMLESKKNYYVKVRAYKKVGSKKLYGSYSVVKSVKVK